MNIDAVAYLKNIYPMVQRALAAFPSKHNMFATGLFYFLVL